MSVRRIIQRYLRMMRSVVSEEVYKQDKVSVDGLCEKFGLRKPSIS